MLTRSVRFSFRMPLNFRRSLLKRIFSRGTDHGSQLDAWVSRNEGDSQKGIAGAESQNGAIPARVEQNLAQDVNLTEADGCP